jgi:hypothetical protein
LNYFAIVTCIPFSDKGWSGVTNLQKLKKKQHPENAKKKKNEEEKRKL